MTIPQELRYTAEHEWIREEDGVSTVGITAFAAESLGDVVYVQLPEVGSTLTAGSPCGEIESTKSVSELFAPATGEVVEINGAVAEEPELINSDPYGKGWLFRVRAAELPELLDADRYRELTSEEA
ncbi:glycine cleavage system protein GcvH [Saccharothrix sp. AJ9571]|nr:glycine cleavage system protein GcvH [Saccharothrix sp. AJ9571]